jgi:hypothetical protein
MSQSQTRSAANGRTLLLVRPVSGAASSGSKNTAYTEFRKRSADEPHLLFAASEMEAQSARKITGSNELVLMICGMGPGNAKAKADAVLGTGAKPDAIVVIGLCGGLTPSLAEGTIVAYTECPFK